MKIYFTLLKIAIVTLCFLSAKNIHSQEFRSQSRQYFEEADTLGDVEGDVKNRIIRGNVRTEKNEIIPIAIIKEFGTKNIVASSVDGSFYIKLNLVKPTFLICSFIGYENDTQLVNDKTKFVKFRLKENYNSLKDIVVSTSRKNERKFESPVAVEILTGRDLQYNATLTMYDRIQNMATVDAITTSINFSTLNTRGFNSSKNHRFIQRFDNMDLSMPGFNLSVGQLNGPIDIDVDRMELIPGASSVLYGPNAISGLMNIMSKSPFQYQGLTVELKTGVNHLDRIDNTPQPLYDFNLRYAKAFSKSFAAKVTMGFAQMSDWHATDYRDISNYQYDNNLTTYGYKVGPGNPGYNGLNIGGDEVSAVIDTSVLDPITKKPFLPKGPLRVSRTGYSEDQLFNYKPYTIKSDIGFYYRPKKGMELSWTSRFGLGSSSFQIDNRAQISNFILQQHKIEFKSKNLTFRSYVSIEDIGEAIDISITAININRISKSDDNWFMQYLFAYSGRYNALAKVIGKDTLIPNNDAAARKFADSDNSGLFDLIKQNAPGVENLILGNARYEVGTKGFDSVLNIVKNNHFNNNGGRIKSTSKTWYSELIYDLSDISRVFTLQTGLNYRLYAPNTQGSVFNDGVNPIYVNEIGGFMLAEKKIMDERLKFQGAFRMDAFQRFTPTFSPRISVVALLGNKKQHSVRASAQIGYRMPALVDQFSDININGAYTFGAFYNDVAKLNLVRNNSDGSPFVNLYTQKSVSDFLYTGDSNKLVKPIIKDIAPEELRTIEIGWRTFLFNKLETDINFYFNTFQNQVTTQGFIGPKIRTDTINAAYAKTQEKTQLYRKAVNSLVPVSSYGISATINYYQNQKWMYYLNYNFNTIVENQAFIEQDYVNGFNTPRNKFNIGFRGTRFYKNWGVSSNLRWVESFYFREYDRIGMIDAYHNLDLMVNYTFVKQKTILKFGGTNITGNRYIQALSSPSVGTILYFSIMYDGLIK